MSKIEPIYLSLEDLKKLQKKKIGSGTDGFVMQYDAHHLIKIYHQAYRNIQKTFLNMNDDSDLKQYQIGESKHKNVEEVFSYYTISPYSGEKIKISPKQIIHNALERSENIHLTRLPKNVVYVSNQFAGCLLEKSNGIQIHKLTGMPLKYKCIILKNVLNAVQELIDNYVYHIDLANSPTVRKSVLNDGKVETEYGHSHILVNPFTLSTNLIDLEGKSTIYTNIKDIQSEHECLRILNILILEFLLKIETSHIESIEELESILETMKLSKHFVDQLRDNEMSLEQCYDFLNYLAKEKRFIKL